MSGEQNGEPKVEEPFDTTISLVCFILGIASDDNPRLFMYAYKHIQSLQFVVWDERK